MLCKLVLLLWLGFPRLLVGCHSFTVSLLERLPTNIEPYASHIHRLSFDLFSSTKSHQPRFTTLVLCVEGVVHSINLPWRLASTTQHHALQKHHEIEERREGKLGRHCQARYQSASVETTDAERAYRVNRQSRCMW